MATKEKTQEAQTPYRDPGEELVDIMLFKDSERYRDDVFVAVNGETCQVKRGVPVKIKRKFAEAIQHSMEQDASTAQLIERAGQNFRQASGVLG